jgi:uncharacterized paraquat-inducible protein A
MAKSRQPSSERSQQQLYCRTCKQDFMAYKSDRTAECPRCGRVSRMPLERHWLRLVAVAIIVAVAAAVVAVYLMRR